MLHLRKRLNSILVEKTKEVAPSRCYHFESDNINETIKKDFYQPNIIAAIYQAKLTDEVFESAVAYCLKCMEEDEDENISDEEMIEFLFNFLVINSPDIFELQHPEDD
jgi:hypothetical protein